MVWHGTARHNDDKSVPLNYTTVCTQLAWLTRVISQIISCSTVVPPEKPIKNDYFDC